MQYYGQDILRSSTTINWKSSVLTDKSPCIDEEFLLLKPISKISDYDFTVVEGMDSIFRVDYLRSKGYALPWLGLSVPDLIQAGWVKFDEIKP